MVGIEDLFPFSQGRGYLGILLISFVGSIIVFVPVPFFPVLVAAALSSKFDPNNTISIVSALGTVIAKTIIFFASFYRRKMRSNETEKRMFPLRRLVSRHMCGQEPLWRPQLRYQMMTSSTYR